MLILLLLLLISFSWPACAALGKLPNLSTVVLIGGSDASGQLPRIFNADHTESPSSETYLLNGYQGLGEVLPMIARNNYHVINMGRAGAYSRDIREDIFGDGTIVMIDGFVTAFEKALRQTRHLNGEASISHLIITVPNNCFYAFQYSEDCVSAMISDTKRVIFRAKKEGVQKILVMAFPRPDEMDPQYAFDHSIELYGSPSPEFITEAQYEHMALRWTSELKVIEKVSVIEFLPRAVPKRDLIDGIHFNFEAMRKIAKRLHARIVKKYLE